MKQPCPTTSCRPLPTHPYWPTLYYTLALRTNIYLRPLLHSVRHWKSVRPHSLQYAFCPMSAFWCILSDVRFLVSASCLLPVCFRMSVWSPYDVRFKPVSVLSAFCLYEVRFKSVVSELSICPILFAIFCSLSLYMHSPPRPWTFLFALTHLPFAYPIPARSSFPSLRDRACYYIVLALVLSELHRICKWNFIYSIILICLYGVCLCPCNLCSLLCLHVVNWIHDWELCPRPCGSNSFPSSCFFLSPPHWLMDLLQVKVTLYLYLELPFLVIKMKLY